MREYVEKNPIEYYWDYRAELSSDQIRKIVEKEDGIVDVEGEIYMSNIDHESDLRDQTFCNLFEEFEDEIVKAYEKEYDEDVIEDVFKDEYWYDALETNLITDINIKALLGRSEEVFFYIMNVDIGDMYEDIEERIKDVKKAFGITSKEYDEQINEMCLNAGYGGVLEIYFKLPLNEILELDGVTHIEFDNPVVAIVDHFNGSGHDTWLPGFKIKLPFNRELLNLCRTASYSYTYDVCGMYSDWCSQTDVELLTEEGKVEIVEVDRNVVREHLVQEDRYKKVFKSGKCTFGDMNMSRHRSITYINDYPCGSKCNDCSTFWID